jgi:hypothetical protein
MPMKRKRNHVNRLAEYPKQLLPHQLRALEYLAHDARRQKAKQVLSDDVRKYLWHCVLLDAQHRKSYEHHLKERK